MTTNTSAAGPLGKALAAIPEWTALRTRLDALNAFTPPTLWRTAAGVADIVEQALAAGEPGEHLLSRVRERMHQDAATELVRSATVTRRQELSLALEQVTKTHADDLLTNLNGQLGALLDQAREVFADLGPVRTAEAAIAASKVKVFPHLAAVRAEYAQIRDAQRRIFSAVESRGRSMRILVSAHIADPLAVHAEHIAHLIHEPVREDLGNGGWKLRDATTPPWPDLGSGEALDWLIAHSQAKPWVPTIGQLDAAESDLEQRCMKRRSEQSRNRATAQRVG